MGVADLCGIPSRHGDDAADPLRHLSLRDDQEVLHASRTPQVTKDTDTRHVGSPEPRFSHRSLPLRHMIRPTGVFQSHVPQQSSTDVRRSVPPSSRSETGTPTDTTRTGSGYTWTVRQNVKNLRQNQGDSQSVRQCIFTSSTVLSPTMHLASCRGSS